MKFSRQENFMKFYISTLEPICISSRCSISFWLLFVAVFVYLWCSVVCAEFHNHCKYHWWARGWL